MSEVGHVGAHLRRAERAVDPDDQGLGMLDRLEERLDRLAREHPAGAIDDRGRDPERQLRDVLAGRDDRRLRVQGVEHRLEQEQVDAALCECPHLLGVGLLHLVEGVRAEGRIVDTGLSDRVTFSGPTEPATKRSPAASRAMRPGEVHLVDGVLRP
jgi:hypothetical protein